MHPTKPKIKESVLKKDGSVEIVKDIEKNNNYSRHLFAIYSLLVLSFTLHLYVIINSAQFLNEKEKVTVIERGRRSVEERNVDPSQLSTANVEFIHPKLKLVVMRRQHYILASQQIFD